MSTRPTQKPVPRPVSQPTKKPLQNPNSTLAKKPVPRAPAPQQKVTTPAQKPVLRAPAPQKPKVAAPAPAKKPAVSAPARAPAPRVPAPKPAAPSEPKAGNWINRTVQERVAGVGSYAAGYVNTVGDAVNAVGAGIGNSITNTTRYWGQGVAGYGNDLKDTVGAGGPRVPVAGNPLGLGGMGSARGALPGGKEAQPALRNAGKKTTASNPLGV